MMIPDLPRKKAEEFMEKERPGSRKRGSSVLDMEIHLDIQSGEELDFYDVRKNKRTCKESDKLNLELNLQPYDEYVSPQEGETTPKRRLVMDEEEEMVATVCMRCHMLVMLCVTRPWCPSCKFLHPKPEQILFKPPPKTAQLLC